MSKKYNGPSKGTRSRTNSGKPKPLKLHPVSPTSLRTKKLISVSSYFSNRSPSTKLKKRSASGNIYTSSLVLQEGFEEMSTEGNNTEESDLDMEHQGKTHQSVNVIANKGVSSTAQAHPNSIVSVAGSSAIQTATTQSFNGQMIMTTVHTSATSNRCQVASTLNHIKEVLKDPMQQNGNIKDSNITPSSELNVTSIEMDQTNDSKEKVSTSQEDHARDPTQMSLKPVNSNNTTITTTPPSADGNSEMMKLLLTMNTKLSMI